jgi:hypothetical protein
MRARKSSGSLGGDHLDSIHHVRPASAKGRTTRAARSGSPRGVSPSQIMLSKGVASGRFSSTYSFIARMSSGLTSPRVV